MRVQRLVAVIALVPAIAAAQQFLPSQPGPPVDPSTRFEVVAIKAIDASGSQVLMRMTPGRFESSVPIGMLLRQALQKPDYEIVGAPGWMDAERYSIAAKVPESTPPAAMQVLLLNLLKDGFKLTTHLETRERPIFHLVMARADGRLGPGLKMTPADCQATMKDRIAAAQAMLAGRGGPPPLPQAFPGPNEPLPCGFGRLIPGLADVSGRTVAQFVTTLSDLTGRPVIDKTGLTGMYDFTLKYSPELGRTAGPLALLSPGAPPPPVDPDAPSVSVALQEQLGLKLENARGPVEVAVIDKLERPMLD